MMRWISRCCLVVLAFGLVSAMAPSADAQTWDIRSRRNATSQMANFLLMRPTVSPYTNLTRRDLTFGGAFNYESIVRPQVEMRQRMAEQQAFSRSLRAITPPPVNAREFSPYQGPMGASAGVRGQMPGAGGGAFATGRPTQFQYYSHFHRPHNPQGLPPGARPF